MKKNNNTAAIIGIAVAVIALVFGGVALTRNIGKSAKTVSKEAAQEKLEKYYKKIAPGELTPVKGQVSYSDEESLYQELPELKNDSIAVPEKIRPSDKLYLWRPTPPRDPDKRN